MSNDVTIPDPQSTFGKCSRCGAEIKIEPVWYRFLQRIQTILNGL